MMLIKRMVLAISLTLAVCLPAATRPLTDAEREALVVVVNRFNSAIHTEDYGAIVNSIPPLVLQHLAKRGGVDMDELKASVAKQMQDIIAEVKIQSFLLDMDHASPRELADGEPYVLIPTEMVMNAGESGRFRVKSQTLALLDKGSWYLMRVNDAKQVLIMRQVYPKFIGVEFAGSSVEALKD